AHRARRLRRGAHPDPRHATAAGRLVHRRWRPRGRLRAAEVLHAVHRRLQRHRAARAQPALTLDGRWPADRRAARRPPRRRGHPAGRRCAARGGPPVGTPDAADGLAGSDRVSCSAWLVSWTRPELAIPILTPGARWLEAERLFITLLVNTR